MDCTHSTSRRGNLAKQMHTYMKLENRFAFRYNAVVRCDYSPRLPACYINPLGFAARTGT
jgi:hypothetical protein